jgi:hypothetical protein
MKKVYCDEKSKQCWIVNEVEDIYSFKCFNTTTGEESLGILTSLKKDPSQFGLDENVKIFSMDFKGEEILFYEKYEDGRILIRCLDPDKLEKIKNELNIVFVGDQLIEN